MLVRPLPVHTGEIVLNSDGHMTASGRENIFKASRRQNIQRDFLVKPAVSLREPSTDLVRLPLPRSEHMFSDRSKVIQGARKASASRFLSPSSDGLLCYGAENRKFWHSEPEVLGQGRKLDASKLPRLQCPHNLL